MKFIYYKNLETIPVYNYYKLSQTTDLRYLIVNCDINDLPEIKDFTHLNLAYDDFTNETDDINFDIQEYYHNSILAVYNYLAGTGSEQKCHDTFNDYCKKLDKYYKSYNFDNQIFDSALKLRNYINEKYLNSEENYLILRYKILYYNNLDAESRGKWDLYADISAIKSLINVDIDEFKCSMSKFKQFKKLAYKKYSEQKNNK